MKTNLAWNVYDDLFDSAQEFYAWMKTKKELFPHQYLVMNVFQGYQTGHEMMDRLQDGLFLHRLAVENFHENYARACQSSMANKIIMMRPLDLHCYRNDLLFHRISEQPIFMIGSFVMSLPAVNVGYITPKDLRINGKKLDLETYINLHVTSIP